MKDILKALTTAGATAVAGPLGGLAANTIWGLTDNEDEMPINPRVQRNLNPYGMQTGGTVQGQNGLVPVEVEGDEMYELPNGEMGEFEGPDHEQGGIQTTLPEGTMVYSKRLRGEDGRTMAQRKESRERRLRKILKELDKKSTDAPTINAVSREVNRLAQEEQEDTQIMQLHQMQQMLADARMQNAQGMQQMAQQQMMQEQMQGEMPQEQMMQEQMMQEQMMQEQMPQEQVAQEQMPMMQVGGMVTPNDPNTLEELEALGKTMQSFENGGTVSNNMDYFENPIGFEDGIVEELPKMKDYAGDETVFPPFGRYKRFKNSLPDNLKNTNEKDYDLRYLWKHSGKPKDMYDAQGWDRNKSFEENYQQDIELLKNKTYDYNKGIFGLVEDLEKDGTVSYNYHGNTIEPNTMRFLKAKNHPTINMELDWYYSNNPNAVDFRSRYDLDTSGKFYRYVPKKKFENGGKVSGGGIKPTPIKPLQVMGSAQDLKEMNRVTITDPIEMIRQHHSNTDDKYLVIDKQKGKQYFYKGGELIVENNVGVGENVSDDRTKTVVRDGKVLWNLGNKSTEAGVFEVDEVDRDSGKYALLYKLRDMDGNKVRHSIHNAFNRSRKNALRDDDPTNNRMSNGCINCLEEDLRKLDKEGFGVNDKVYILPEEGYNYMDEEFGDVVMKTRYTGGDLPEVTVKASRLPKMSQYIPQIQTQRDNTMVNLPKMRAGGVISQPSLAATISELSNMRNIKPEMLQQEQVMSNGGGVGNLAGNVSRGINDLFGNLFGRKKSTTDVNATSPFEQRMANILSMTTEDIPRVESNNIINNLANNTDLIPDDLSLIGAGIKNLQPFGDFEFESDKYVDYSVPGPLANIDPNKTYTKDEVKDIQQTLQDAGYDLGKSGVDGIFGPLTKAALKKFNEEYFSSPIGAATPANVFRLAGSRESDNLLGISGQDWADKTGLYYQLPDGKWIGGEPGKPTQPQSPPPPDEEDAFTTSPLTTAGYLTSGISPLLTTIFNRLGDEPTPNFYANYGRDAERALDAAERGIAGARDRGFEENRLAQNLRARQARNAARSSNVQQAMQQAALTSGMKANEALTGQYQNALRALLANRAQFEQSQDQTVMRGREQAYTADLQNRDKFFTNLAQNLTNTGSMMQSLGRQKDIFNYLNEERRQRAEQAKLASALGPLASLSQLFQQISGQPKDANN